MVSLLTHSRRSSLQGEFCPVLNLPPEVLHRCLSQLESEERCQSIPLVCKSFLQNHLDFPPMRKQWGMDGPGSVTATMVQWFLHAGSSCEPVWEGWKDHPGVPGDFELLSSFIMENLGGKGGQLLSSLLQCLSSETYFLLIPGKFQEDANPRGSQHLRTGIDFPLRSAGFLSLRVVMLLISVADHRPTPDEADALFGALARVQNLETVKLCLSWNMEGAPVESLRQAVSTVFRSVGLMKQIRQLRFFDELMVLLDEKGMLPWSLASLTKLRELDMSFAFVPVSSFSPIMGLPSLEELQIAVEARGQPSPLCLSSEKLTRLDIIGGLASSADQYLPSTLPYLGQLRRLSLKHMKLEAFPHSVAGALTSLTHLDLSYNLFVRIPPELAHVPTLQVILMRHNVRLQLQLDDGLLLAALSSLRTLDFSVVSSRFAARNSINRPNHLLPRLRRENDAMWNAIVENHTQLIGLELLDACGA